MKKKLIIIFTLFFVINLVSANQKISQYPLEKAFAHNDYEHARPLYDALQNGFTNIEADIIFSDNKLNVAHDDEDIREGRTLEELYLKPLKKIIDSRGYIYDKQRSIRLFIDIKTEAEPTYKKLKRVLKKYKEYLTYYDNGKKVEGKINIIISGSRPKKFMSNEKIRFAGWDGRISDIGSDISKDLMPVISDNAAGYFDWRGKGEISSQDYKKLQKYVQQIHSEGRLVRFWSTDVEDKDAQIRIWKVLLKANVDIINSDKLEELASFLRNQNLDKNDLAQYVDPFIGTGGHGHTYPGATLPFGMVQLSPDTRTGNWDACGGYHYSDSTILGFSHQHLSGVGILDYGDILLMPTTGKIQINPGPEKNTRAGYRSKFRHKTEKAEPGYYSVILEDYNILAEVTATQRAGFHRYTFEQDKKQNLIIDLDHSLETNETVDRLEFEKTAANEIRGLRRSKGWARDQIVYFVAKFSKDIEDIHLSSDGENLKEIEKLSGKSIKAALQFDKQDQNKLLIKVGISAVDYEGARKNLEAEIPDWNFDKTRKKAKSLWNKQLSKIKIENNCREDKTIFYTALYHAMIVPNTYFDVDRRYRGNDRKIHSCNDFDNYTVFSLWDTFRATHPLFTIIERERTVDFLKTFQKIYDQTGVLPKWELAGNETGTMIGYHSVSAIADAYAKGIKDFNFEKIYGAMKATANQDKDDINLYKEYGYIPDYRIESVSKTLEYAYDDWCISIMAKELERSEDNNYYKNRAYNYQNLFDGSTGFMRGKKKNGNWIVPFDPFDVTREYTEANAWHYSLFVPHDVQGLVNLHGGKENFIKHLDDLFTKESPSKERQLADITGLIGQYAHGNEPSHHKAYLYNFVDQPWKTQAMINKINNQMYTTCPDGIVGNEDCGQMSAWYIFSSIGFYPFLPGTDQYLIGTPSHERSCINLENGKKFVVEAKNLSENNYYIQSAQLNGKEYNLPFINHSDIMKGGKLVFEMGKKPNKSWGKFGKNLYSMTKVKTTSIPFLTGDDVSYFTDNAKVGLDCATPGVDVRYTLDGSEPTKKSKLFSNSFMISKTTTIKARAFKDNMKTGPVMKTIAQKAKFLDPVQVDNLVQGINYEYYEGKFSSVYDMQD